MVHPEAHVGRPPLKRADADRVAARAARAVQLLARQLAECAGEHLGQGRTLWLLAITPTDGVRDGGDRAADEQKLGVPYAQSDHIRVVRQDLHQPLEGLRDVPERVLRQRLGIGARVLDLVALPDAVVIRLRHGEHLEKDV